MRSSHSIFDISPGSLSRSSFNIIIPLNSFCLFALTHTIAVVQHMHAHALIVFGPVTLSGPLNLLTSRCWITASLGSTTEAEAVRMSK